MVISGNLLIGNSEQCFHVARHRNASLALGIMFHERFDLGQGWADINVGRWGIQIHLTRIRDVRKAEADAEAMLEGQSG